MTTLACPACPASLTLLGPAREAVCPRCAAWLRRDDDRGWHQVEELADPAAEAAACQFYRAYYHSGSR